MFVFAKRPQAFASVRKASAEGRTCRRDERDENRREMQNCRHFWTRLGSSRLKSVNSHRDRGGRGRETQNCRHFWTRLASSCLKSVNSRGSWSRNPELSSLLDSPLERGKVRGEK